MSLKRDIDKSTKKDRLRRRIIQLRRRDRAFAFAGLAVMAGAFIVLLALLGQLVYDGMGRISWQFFASYPSRFASQAGILSAWIGTVLVMLLTRSWRRLTWRRILAVAPLGLLALDRKSTRLNSSHSELSRMPSSA